MSRTNIFQVALTPDAAAELKRRAAASGLPAATYARVQLLRSMGVLHTEPKPKKAKRP